MDLDVKIDSFQNTKRLLAYFSVWEQLQSVKANDSLVFVVFVLGFQTYWL